MYERSVMGFIPSFPKDTTGQGACEDLLTIVDDAGKTDMVVSELTSWLKVLTGTGVPVSGLSKRKEGAS
jgi:hypothetical protein